MITIYGYFLWKNSDYLTAKTIYTHAYIRRILRHYYAITFIQIKHSVFDCKVHNHNSHIKVGLFRMLTNYGERSTIRCIEKCKKGNLRPNSIQFWKCGLSCSIIKSTRSRILRMKLWYPILQGSVAFHQGFSLLSLNESSLSLSLLFYFP